MRLSAAVGWLIAVPIIALSVDQLVKGLMPTLHSTNRVPVSLMLVAVAIVVCVGAVQRRFAPKVFVSLIIGAALGNIVDIARFGVVRDVFIAGPIAFNVADLGIAIGLVAFLLMLFIPKKTPSATI